MKSQAPFSGPMPTRKKDVQFLSISPLDRLLNQRGLEDDIRVEVSCTGANGQRISNANSQEAIRMDKSKINRMVCHDGSEPTDENPCQLQSNKML